MMRRLLLLLLTLPVAGAGMAQVVSRSTSPVVRAYIDSLHNTKLHLDTTHATTQLQQGLTSVEDFMLFSPFTYFHAPIHRVLTMQDSTHAAVRYNVAQQLLNMYLRHPEAVSTDESSLRNVQGIDAVVDKPLISQGTLTGKDNSDIIDPGTEVVEVLVRKPNFWTISGDYYLQFLQNSVSGNWHKGGESNYSALASITMQANYNNKQKVKWDNKLELKLGFIHSRSDSLHRIKTSEDLIRYTGKLGLQATKRWYYTFQALAYTQFYRGYKANDPMVYSCFFAPFNLNLSLGMDYTVEAFHKRLKGTVHLAPIAYNFRYVRRPELATRYGLKEGKRMLHDKGSQFTVDLEWKFSDMVSWKTRLYAFTTYKKAEMEWENTIAFKFNRYISSNLFLYPRFDDGVKRDDHHAYWQFKEFLSVGFAYSF